MKHDDTEREKEWDGDNILQKQRRKDAKKTCLCYDLWNIFSSL